jgi:hypothetical protein
MTNTGDATQRRHSESRRLTEQIGLRLSPKERAAVEAAAAKHKLGVPDLLRFCLAAQGIDVGVVNPQTPISTVNAAYQRAS